MIIFVIKIVMSHFVLHRHRQLLHLIHDPRGLRDQGGLLARPTAGGLGAFPSGQPCQSRKNVHARRWRQDGDRRGQLQAGVVGCAETGDTLLPSPRWGEEPQGRLHPTVCGPSVHRGEPCVLGYHQSSQGEFAISIFDPWTENFWLCSFKTQKWLCLCFWMVLQ